MTSAFAFAPFNTSYELRTPYLTVAEFNNTPNALDTANLLPGGPGPNQSQALQEVISRASSWIDQYTCGAWGTLCSTAEVENARVWGSYRNTLPVHPKYWPITEVRAFSYSALPGGLVSSNGASITPAGNITVYPQMFEVAITGIIAWGLNAPAGIVRGCEYDTQYTYVCGWPNTTLAASVAAGATSIQPTTVNGIYPGTQLSLNDLPNDESVTVSSSYVAGASVVTLTSALQYSHQTTATVTNLPPAIKQAAILATTAFIKIRGSGALEVADMGMITHQTSGMPQGSGDDLYKAQCLLNPYRQTYVGW